MHTSSMAYDHSVHSKRSAFRVSPAIAARPLRQAVSPRFKSTVVYSLHTGSGDGHADRNGNGHASSNGNGHANGLTGSNGHIGLPLSMFTPYKDLPPDGEMVSAEEAECDPATMKCKTPIYTYESKCLHCCGTGFVRSRANGRHASMWTCLPCNGLGYVRRATARFVPDGDGSLTLARPSADPAAKARAARMGQLKALHAQHEQQGQELLRQQQAQEQGQRAQQSRK